MAIVKPLKISKHKTQLSKHWYVVYCKPNTEKKTAISLNEIGVKAYCPTKTEVRQWTDRKKKIQVPVLPSMVLVCLADKERQQVFQVPSVVRFLFWLKKPAIVSDKEIVALKKLLSGDTSNVEIEKIKVGDKIKLKGLGFDDEEVKLKYVSKTHYCVYLERLGYMIKVKK